MERANNASQILAPSPKRCATVVTPLTWSELEGGIQPTDFTILNIMKRLDKKGDLFKPLTTEKHNQSLSGILSFIEKNKVFY